MSSCPPSGKPVPDVQIQEEPCQPLEPGLLRPPCVRRDSKRITNGGFQWLGRAFVLLLFSQLCLCPSRAQNSMGTINRPAFRSVRLGEWFDQNIPMPDSSTEFRHEARGLASGGFVGSRESFRNHLKLAPFGLLSMGVYGLASLDMHETVATCACHEHDPLARPLTKLPTPAYYVSGVALATGVNWIAWKMAHSRRWHRIWWLPQVAAMAGNLWGYTSTKAQE